MVTLLFPSKEESGKHKRFGTTAPNLASTILRPPIPPPLEAIGRFTITSHDVEGMSHYPSLGYELTEAAKAALGKDCRADYVMVNGSVVCGLDSQDVVHYQAVGKRMDSIAMRHGTDVARSILDKLSECPIEIYTPRKQLDNIEMFNCLDECEDWYIEKTVGALYPKWSWMTTKDWFGDKRKKRTPRPVRVPKELDRLMDECDAAHSQTHSDEWSETTVDYFDWCEVQPFPFATLCWEAGAWAPEWAREQYMGGYGNVPEKTMGRDPSWIHLYPSFQNGQENGAMMFIPHHPFHSEDMFIKFLGACKPYMNLLDYITHECG